MTRRLLAGDVGGTKTELGLFTAGGGEVRLAEHRLFASREHPGLRPMVASFLAACGVGADGIAAACFGVAGPVRGRRSRPPNLPWAVDAEQLEREVPLARVVLVNDLFATAEGIAALGPGDVAELARGDEEPGGTRALIAAGTGLGMATMPFVDGRWVPAASEGGHADFAPPEERQLDLWRYLAARFGHVSVERVVSGPGIAHIYAYLGDAEIGSADPGVEREVESADDAAAAITAAALAGRCRRAALALELFTTALGAAAGNLALTALATGGLYLGGGIPPRIRRLLEEGPFLAAFSAKGRFSELMERIPVRLILEPRTALLGAGRIAARAAA